MIVFITSISESPEGLSVDGSGQEHPKGVEPTELERLFGTKLGFRMKGVYQEIMQEIKNENPDLAEVIEIIPPTLIERRRQGRE